MPSVEAQDGYKVDTKMKLIELPNQEYEVRYYNDVLMGHLSRAHDLFYNFWPANLDKGGFWSQDGLRFIVENLERLNKPIAEEFDKWCEEHPPQPLDDKIFSN